MENTSFEANYDIAFLPSINRFVAVHNIEHWQPILLLKSVNGRPDLSDKTEIISIEITYKLSKEDIQNMWQTFKIDIELCQKEANNS